MNAKTCEVENGVEKQKRGTLEGQLAAVSPFPRAAKEDEKPSREAKSSVAYWKTRVRPRKLPNGKTTPEFYVRMKEGGRDSWLCLNTANRTDAARDARDLWQQVQVKGLAAVLAERRPDVRPARVASVGEYLTAAHAVTTTRTRTFAQYETALRRIVAGVFKIDCPPARFAAGSPANAEWRAKIDAIRLDRINATAVKAWQKMEIDAAPDESARDARAHSVSSNVRNARALFSEGILSELRKKLTLPAELPFSAVKVSATTRRFESTVDPRALYAAAWGNLAADELAAFLLLLVGGLRRSEADLLPWANLNLAGGTVRVETTKWFTPKSRESTRTLPLPDDVAKFFTALRAAAPNAEFVLKGSDPRPAGRQNFYRANAWKPLTVWLRKQGVTTRTPLHALRKMSGSLIYATAGIESARRHLGHSTISTTAASYLQSGAAIVDLSAK